jgi:hypothetical protein
LRILRRRGSGDYPGDRRFGGIAVDMALSLLSGGLAAQDESG